MKYKMDEQRRYRLFEEIKDRIDELSEGNHFLYEKAIVALAKIFGL